MLRALWPSSVPAELVLWLKPLVTLQLNVSQRKAEGISSSDCSSKPAGRRPAPVHLFDDRPEVQGTTGEIAAQSRWQLRPTKGGLAYAAVVAWVASLQWSSGPNKSPVKGSDHTESAA